MDIVRKGIAGGLVTAAIVFLSRRGNMLPGILPLFPTFALIALLIVGAKGDDSGVPRSLPRRGQDDTGLSGFSGGLLFRGRLGGLPDRPARRAGRLVYRRPGRLPRAPLDLTTIRIAEFGRHFAVACAGAKR
jgi:hypothetical protein